MLDTYFNWSNTLIYWQYVYLAACLYVMFYYIQILQTIYSIITNVPVTDTFKQYSVEQVLNMSLK